MTIARTIRRLLLASFLLAAAFAWAQKDFPSGWGAPTPEQLGLKVRADFDGDGKPDTAQVLTDVNKRAVAVMAYTTSNRRWSKLDSDTVKQAPKWRVRLVEPGSYTLTCAADDKHCAPGPAKLEYPGVAIVVEGQPDEVFFWVSQDRKFQHGLLSSPPPDNHTE